MLRDENGFALPLALSIMALVGLLAAATVGFATHNTDRSVRDLQATRALQAADAGVEAATYRMNKAVSATQVDGILGIDLLTDLTCVDISLGQLTIVPPLNGDWCPATESTEHVDGAAAGSESWTPAEYSYWVSLAVPLGNPSAGLIERRVVSVGTVGDVTKRVLATIHLSVGSNGNLLKLFEQVGYRECDAAVPEGDDPTAGC